MLVVVVVVMMVLEVKEVQFQTKLHHLVLITMLAVVEMVLEVLVGDVVLLMMDSLVVVEDRKVVVVVQWMEQKVELELYGERVLLELQEVSLHLQMLHIFLTLS